MGLRDSKSQPTMNLDLGNKPTRIYQNVLIRWLKINGSVGTVLVDVQILIIKDRCHKRLVVTLRSASLEFN